MRRWNSQIHQHLADRLGSYFFVVVLFVVGVVFGAVAVRALTFSQKQELLSFLQQFFSTGVAAPQGSAAFLRTLLTNLQTLGLAWVMGLLVFGLPVIILLVFFQGFVLGFSVGFLVHQMAYKGLLFAFCSVLPHNLLLVPANLFVAATALHFILLTLKPQRYSRTVSYWQRFLQYSRHGLLAVVVVFAASIIETWFSPLLLRLIARFF